MSSGPVADALDSLFTDLIGTAAAVVLGLDLAVRRLAGAARAELALTRVRRFHKP
ncbi:hypothetical protein ACIBF6_28370 [Streptosporangium amethystogenes]|uniref:hypothetical protein n=1 Tax=Streptosporangium amethystogenes TaxID=2002 RepID=UPI003796ABF3